MQDATTARGREDKKGKAEAQSPGPFVLLQDVLQIHHATAPSQVAVSHLDAPETLDDCLIATAASIARYHLKAPHQWVNYEEIQAAMKATRQSGPGHNYPYPRERV